LILPPFLDLSTRRKTFETAAERSSLTMASDASDSTVAAYGLDVSLSNFVFKLALLPHEVGQSSALREIGVIHKTLLCRGKML
jgi:hypothetical protein